MDRREDLGRGWIGGRSLMSHNKVHNETLPLPTPYSSPIPILLTPSAPASLVYPVESMSKMRGRLVTSEDIKHAKDQSNHLVSPTRQEEDV